MTRPALERRCEAALGITAQAYLRKLRIVRAREPPASTRLPVGEIATARGFAQMEHLRAMFRRECGMSPQDFRSRRRARLASHR